MTSLTASRDVGAGPFAAGPPPEALEVTYPPIERFGVDLRGRVSIDGAGHWVQQERPAEVNAALIEFLEELSA